jgi:SRSO17 transposase
MKRRELERLRKDLTNFAERITEGMGRPERRDALRHYMTGLMLEGERKSIAPMAERLSEFGDAEAMRQRMQQAVVVANWSESDMFRRIARELTGIPELEAFVIDDTGFPKKGEHSVGVARQYSGTLGRTDNCQVATSLHVAGERGSGCIGMRLYLPESWAEDRERRLRGGVPEEVEFKKKGELALQLLDAAIAWGLPQRIVLADAGYGDSGDFRRELAARGLQYVVAVTGTATVFSADDNDASVVTNELAATARFRRITWRDGSCGRQSARFAALRVQPVRRKRVTPDAEQWLLIEETNLPTRPFKFYLSNMPPGTSVKTLVRLAKLRWRIERDYQELKGELGLDHFEGRTWLGFHHHAALCAAAHAFLAIRRAVFPPIEHAMDTIDGPQGAAASSAATSP